MTATLSDTQPEQKDDARPEFPDASVLENRMPEWFQLSRTAAGWVSAIGIVFCLLNYAKLYHSDLWGHLAFGRWIAESDQVPHTAQLMPLASGMPFVDTAWLSQLFGFIAFDNFGPSALQFLYAGSITFCLALLAWRLYHRTGSTPFTLLGLVAFGWADWQQLLIIRPQLIGLMCFVALFTMLTARKWRTIYWAVIPALFVVWANCHGSFVVGILLLAAFAAGRAIDIAYRMRRFRPVLADRRVRRYFVLAELAAVAALINPYGFEIYPAIFAFSDNENLQMLLDWLPLTIEMKQGVAALTCAAVLACLYRLTPRRISAVEPLLLFGLGYAALSTSRMLVWWAPVAAYYLAIHAHAAYRAHFVKKPETAAPEPSPSTPIWAVVAIGMVWICFGFTPFGSRVLHGKTQPLKEVVSPDTPHDAVEFMKKFPPVGQVFNTYEWGDYLLWQDPQAFEVFVASHVQLIPDEVWNHYLEVINTAAGWKETLDLYGVNAVLVDKRYRDNLIGRLRRESEEWHVAYEDNIAVVFYRNEPVGADEYPPMVEEESTGDLEPLEELPEAEAENTDNLELPEVESENAANLELPDPDQTDSAN